MQEARFIWVGKMPPGEANGNPLQCSCLGNPMDRGAWWVTVHRVAKSWTRQWLNHHQDADTHLWEWQKLNSYSKCWWGYGGVWTLMPSWWECKMVQVLCKPLWQFLKIQNVHLASDPVFSLLGIYQREMKEYVHTKMYVLLFTADL